MRFKKYPDIEFLRCILRYEMNTGKLFWNERSDLSNAWNKKHVGAEALYSVEPSGYLRGTIRGEQYKTHRIAWGIFHGRYPELEIDHINGIKSDNRITNLREASRSENQSNNPIRSDNTSGHKGVSWKARNSKWQASIAVDGKVIYLGIYKDIEDAKFAYEKASIKYHGEYGRI